MRYKDAERFDGMIIWASGGLRGPVAVPGIYNTVLVNGKDSASVPFEIVKDQSRKIFSFNSILFFRLAINLQILTKESNRLEIFVSS